MVTQIEIEHRDAPEGERHPPHNWTFANQAAREAAGAYTNADVGKWALQSSDGSLWRLVSQAGGVPTWAGIGGGDVSQAELDAETAARIAAVSGEATARAAADTTLQNNINTEAAARIAGDGELQDEFTDVSTALSNETAARTSADATHAALTTTAHGGIVASTDGRLTDARTPTVHHTTHNTGGTDPIAPADIGAATAANLTNEIFNRGFADAAEATARGNADTTLQTNITSEATARASADTTLQTNITAEASARATADSTHAALTTTAHGGIVADSDTRLRTLEQFQDTVAAMLAANSDITPSYTDASGIVSFDLTDVGTGDSDVRGSVITYDAKGRLLAIAGGWPYGARVSGTPDFARWKYGYGIDAAGGDVEIALPDISSLSSQDLVWFFYREDDSANVVSFTPAVGNVISDPYSAFTLDGQGAACMLWAVTERNQWQVFNMPVPSGGGGGGGPVALDDLTDVVITSPVEGYMLSFDGSNWIDQQYVRYYDGALLIGSSAATAFFRLLPYGSDIYFQNTTNGNMYFTGAGGSALAGSAIFDVIGIGLNMNDAAGGTGVLMLADATTAPTTSPSSGSVLYSQGGKLRVVGHSKAAGEIATLADIPAVPTTEDIQDIVGTMVVAGTNATVTYNDPAGTLTIAASGSTGFSALMDAIIDFLATNTDPRDTKLTSGSYVALVYFSSHNANSFKSATNATHTVTAGKKLVILYVVWASKVVGDGSGARHARLLNSTDTAVVVTTNDTYQKSSPFIWDGDVAVTSKFPEVAAGKTVVMQIQNTDTNKRAAGGFIIGKEV